MKGNKVPITISVVSEYCQVSKSTVLKWIKDGKLRAYRLPSGHYRIDREDFRAFLENYNIPIKEWLFEESEIIEGRG